MLLHEHSVNRRTADGADGQPPRDGSAASWTRSGVATRGVAKKHRGNQTAGIVGILCCTLPGVEGNATLC
jgi:hypothetical protein